MRRFHRDKTKKDVRSKFSVAEGLSFIPKVLLVRSRDHSKILTRLVAELVDSGFKSPSERWIYIEIDCLAHFSHCIWKKINSQ